jgi:hypothetical protein
MRLLYRIWVNQALWGQHHEAAIDLERSAVTQSVLGDVPVVQKETQKFSTWVEKALIDATTPRSWIGSLSKDNSSRPN